MGIICGKSSIDENSIVPLNAFQKAILKVVARAPKKNEKCQFVLMNKDANNLLLRRIKSRNDDFTEKQSILLLNELIGLGFEYAEKTTGKDQLLVVGMTGAGKSTIVNYLVGCRMELLTKEQHKIPNLLVPIVKVKDDSPIQEQMKIGHSDSVSMTVMSDSFYASELEINIVDAAGFYDTRGFEINISNNVNLKAMINNSKSIRVVLLISWYSLLADRSTGLNSMLEMAYQIFGSREQLIKKKDSILINVTRIPSDITFGQIQDKFLSSDSEEIRLLGERLIIFDIFESGEIKDSSNREESYDKIRELEKIRNPSEFFNIALTDKDEKELLKQSKCVLKNIKDHLSDAEITLNNKTILTSYKKASQELLGLASLKRIDHPKTLEIYEEAEQSVVLNINSQKKSILEIHVVENFDFKKAEDKATTMEKALQFFEESIIEKIDITSFKKQINESKGKYDKLLDSQKSQFQSDLKQDPRAIAQLLNDNNKQEILSLFESEPTTQIKNQTNIEERVIGNLDGNIGGNVKLGNENTNVNTGNNTDAPVGNVTNTQNRQVGDIIGTVGGDVIIGDQNYNINLNNNFIDDDILKNLSAKNDFDENEVKFDDLSPEEQEKIKGKLSKVISDQKERYLREMPGLVKTVMDREENKNIDQTDKAAIQEVLDITQLQFEQKMREEFMQEAKNTMINKDFNTAEEDENLEEKAKQLSIFKEDIFKALGTTLAHLVEDENIYEAKKEIEQLELSENDTEEIRREKKKKIRTREIEEYRRQEAQKKKEIRTKELEELRRQEKLRQEELDKKQEIRTRELEELKRQEKLRQEEQDKKKELNLIEELKRKAEDEIKMRALEEEEAINELKIEKKQEELKNQKEKKNKPFSKINEANLNDLQKVDTDKQWLKDELELNEAQHQESQQEQEAQYQEAQYQENQLKQENETSKILDEGSSLTKSDGTYPIDQNEQM